MHVINLMTGFGGGISSFVQNKAEALQEYKDITCDVITFDEVSSRFETAINGTGGTIYQIPSPNLKNILSVSKKVYHLFKNMPKGTVVHSHFGMNLVLYFYVLAKLAGINRFLIHAHTDAPPRIKYSLKNKMNRLVNSSLADQMVSCGSDASANIFGERNVNLNRIMHIPNSINVEDFTTSNDTQQIKSDILGEKKDREYIIGNVARFHPQKNHIFMIKIIEELVNQGVSFVWLFVGDGELIDDIKKLCHEKNLNNHVVFLGRRNDVPKILSILDYFVLPSLYEGLPTVAVEAQAAGIRSLLSEEVTDEVDLDLGLVDFLNIDDPGVWVEKIIKTEPIYVTVEDRITKIEEKKFTNDTSAELYRQFLLGNISDYNI